MPAARLALALALALVAPWASGAPAEDAVGRLPGWDGPLPSQHYSGYLGVGNASGAPGFLHYWFITAEAAAPANAPVLLWYLPGEQSLHALQLLLSLKRPAEQGVQVPALEPPQPVCCLPCGHW